MAERNVHVDTLRLAAETIGGSDEFARAIGVTTDRLRAWMAGIEPLPLEVFLDALDVIAEGPFASSEPGARRRRASHRPAGATA